MNARLPRDVSQPLATRRADVLAGIKPPTVNAEPRHTVLVPSRARRVTVDALPIAQATACARGSTIMQSHGLAPPPRAVA